MTNFGFISDEQLRNAIDRDKRELDSCLKNQLCKSTLLLAGSIIEAVLVDYFLAFPKANMTPQKVLTANLVDLIDWAEGEGLITSRTKELSTVCKSYRNLIHPGREYRLNERVDIHTATVAASLVEIIIEEVADGYGKRLGYTASQAISKIRMDPTSSSIFESIVEKMALVERVKLFRAIPSTCQSGNDTDTVIGSFVALHGLLKSNVPSEVLLTETQKAYDVIHNSTKMDAMFYLRFFVDNLELLEEKARETIVEYVLSIVRNSSEYELRLFTEWGIFRHLGRYLNSDNGRDRLYLLLVELMVTAPSSKDPVLLPLVKDLSLNLNEDRAQHIAQILREVPIDNERSSKWASCVENPIF